MNMVAFIYLHQKWRKIQATYMYMHVYMFLYIDTPHSPLWQIHVHVLTRPTPNQIVVNVAISTQEVQVWHILSLSPSLPQGGIVITSKGHKEEECFDLHTSLLYRTVKWKKFVVEVFYSPLNDTQLFFILKSTILQKLFYTNFILARISNLNLYRKIALSGIELMVFHSRLIPSNH